MAELRHSYSSLMKFHECPRAWSYRFLEGLSSLGVEGALAPLRGTAFHALVQSEMVTRGAAAGTLLERPLTIEPVPGYVISIDWKDERYPTIPTADLVTEELLSPLVVLGHIKEWEASQDDFLRTAMVGLYEGTLYDRLADLWFRYRNHYADSLNDFMPLAVEHEWAREAPNGVLLQGRLDAVGFNTKHGIFEVRDVKTHENWPADDDSWLLWDSQLHLQAWGVAPLLSAQGSVLSAKFDVEYVKPQMVTYDRARFKKPSEPKLTAKGVLDKRVSDFSPESYKSFFESPEAQEAGLVMDENVYASLAAPGKWFRMQSTPINMNVITTHVLSLQELAAQAQAMETHKALLRPSKACSWCEFNQLCESELRGGRVPLDVETLMMYGLKKQGLKEIM